MKKVLLQLILIFSQTVFSQENIEIFNNSLGSEQAKAFDAAAISFNTFLEINYPNDSSHTAQIAHYLGDLKKPAGIADRFWEYPRDIVRVHNLWNTSGLRKEVKLWTNEKYNPNHYENHDSILSNKKEFHQIEEEELIPIKTADTFTTKDFESKDSSTYFNLDGRYFFALVNLKSSKPFIIDYLKAKKSAGDISPSLIAHGLSQYPTEFDDQIFLRIMVAEFYYYFIF